jgi:hypothetical protein
MNMTITRGAPPGGGDFEILRYIGHFRRYVGFPSKKSAPDKKVL